MMKRLLPFLLAALLGGFSALPARATVVNSFTAPLALNLGGCAATTSAGCRTSLGLGTAALLNSGTSGATVPLLNGMNTWAGAQTFSAALLASGGGAFVAPTSSSIGVQLAGDSSLGVGILEFSNNARNAEIGRLRFNNDGSGNLGYGSSGTANVFSWTSAGAVTTPLSLAVGAGGALTSTGAGGALGTNAFTSTAIPAAANPTATIGTTAVNGVATTYMRSDAAPALGNLTGAVTSAGLATSLGSFTSAQLAGALTNETGTGLAVFATSPALTTPTATTLAVGGATIGTDALGVAGSTTLGGAATVAQGTIVAAVPALSVTSTWNNGAVVFDGLKVNITGTAADATSRLMKFTYNGTDLFTLNTVGTTTFFGSNVVGGNLRMSSDTNAITLGAANDVVFSRAGAAILRHGLTDAAAPVAQTETVQGVVTGTSNTAGTLWKFVDSTGTGTGTSGGYEFDVHPAGSTGSTPNAAAAALTLNGAKLATFPGTVAIGAGSAITSSGAGGALSASAFTDTTNASNIASGTLPAARLPNPSSSTLGGVQSAAAVSNQWINSISTSGVPALSQPAFTNISGVNTVAQGGTGDTGTAWTAYTPTLGCGSGTLTSASAAGYYKVIGKTMFYHADVTITTLGTCASSIGFGFPQTLQTPASWSGVETALSRKALSVYTAAGTNFLSVSFYDGTFPASNGAVFSISGTVQIQ